MRQISLRGSLRRTNKAEQDRRLTRFCEEYSPGGKIQQAICGNPAECFFGNYPTLAQLKADCGSNAAKIWMVTHLHNLSEYCGCKGKLTDTALEQCAYTLSTEFHYLKVSELMLFFHRFKTARYGKFYGDVDPQVIAESLRLFCKERQQCYDQHEILERQRREEEDRQAAVSYDEWLAMKGKHNDLK